MSERDDLIRLAQQMNRCLSVIVDVAQRGRTDTDIVRRQYGIIATTMGEMAKVIFR